jgi:hypothetical protein
MKINESVDATKDLVEELNSGEFLDEYYKNLHVDVKFLDEEEHKNEGFAVCVSVLFGVSVFSLWLVWELIMMAWGE